MWKAWGGGVNFFGYFWGEFGKHGGGVSIFLGIFGVYEGDSNGGCLFFWVFLDLLTGIADWKGGKQ